MRVPCEWCFNTSFFFVLFCVLGYEVYLVGGCVRDLILNRTPKDFDIITSAELKEVGLNFYSHPTLQWC
jgi:tRNA nucleotidyltransferase/poly(A) polymerase